MKYKMKQITYSLHYEIAFDGDLEVTINELTTYLIDELDFDDPQEMIKAILEDPDLYEDEIYNATHSYVLDNLSEIKRSLDQYPIENGFYLEVKYR